MSIDPDQIRAAAQVLADDSPSAFRMPDKRPTVGAMHVARKMLEAAQFDLIRWARVNDEPYEFAIRKGRFGDEFVKCDGNCLRRLIEALP